MSRPALLASRNVEVGLGIGALIAGMLLLRDAYDTRGHPQPLWLRPFSWW